MPPYRHSLDLFRGACVDARWRGRDKSVKVLRLVEHREARRLDIVQVDANSVNTGEVKFHHAANIEEGTFGLAPEEVSFKVALELIDMNAMPRREQESASRGGSACAERGGSLGRK